jgi:hypothetical protein
MHIEKHKALNDIIADWLKDNSYNCFKQHEVYKEQEGDTIAIYHDYYTNDGQKPDDGFVCHITNGTRINRNGRGLDVADPLFFRKLKELFDEYHRNIKSEFLNCC